MKILNFTDFVKKYSSKDDTMNDSQQQKKYNYPMYPRDSKLSSDKGFINLENGFQGETRWTCFYTKENKLYYFDSFGGNLENFLLNQLPKPIKYHYYKKQDINFRLCGSYCLYFFDLSERRNYYVAILKMYFR